MLQNFSFIIDGVLAGSALPGQYFPLRDDLEQARAEGITGIVSAREQQLAPRELKAVGIEGLHLAVPDYAPPAIGQLEQFVAFVDRHRANSGAVLVHCRAGVGRTGTMLAAYLIHQGSTADEAIRQVRQRRHGSIETWEQEEALRQWADHLAARRKQKS